MSAKAVYLIAPGYRRWLTPDATELVFEAEGFAAKEAKNWQARLIVSDLDGGAEANSTFPIDLSRKTFSLPAPKFHRRAEIILFIENPRDREPVCEGRWKLTNIPKEELANLNYFDSRGVFFHEGVGRFPITAFPSDDPSSSKWGSLVAAGFNSIIVPSEFVDEKSVAVAKSLKLFLFAVFGGPTEGAVEARKKEVKRLTPFTAVAGYGHAALKDVLMACRAADASRPMVTVLPLDRDIDDLGPEFAEYQDVFSMHYPTSKEARRHPLCARSGRPHFGWAAEEDFRDHGVTPLLLTAVARGASGFAFVATLDKLTSTTVVDAVKSAQPLVNAVVRGVPELSEDSTEDCWFWRRRLGPNERAVIEVKRGDHPMATFKIERVDKENGERGA